MNSLLLRYSDEFRALSDFTYALRWLCGTTPLYNLTWGECIGCFHGTMTDHKGKLITKRGTMPHQHGNIRIDGDSEWFEGEIVINNTQRVKVSMGDECEAHLAALLKEFVIAGLIDKERLQAAVSLL